VSTTHLPNPSHLTAADLAERWQVSTGHLANLRCLRAGPRYLKIGGAVRYAVADVAAYEATCSVEPIRGKVA